jgi:hypothetical protein
MVGMAAIMVIRIAKSIMAILTESFRISSLCAEAGVIYELPLRLDVLYVVV